MGGLSITGVTAARPTPEETHELWKAVIAAGADYIYFVYDMPTQMGYDPDHPMAEGEIGRVGISLISQKDWEVVFDGIDIGKVKVGQVANANAVVGIANHLVIAEKQGVDWRELRGHCQNDILKDYYARGTYIFPPRPAVRLVIDAISYCAKHAPNYIPIEVSTYQAAEKGADAALEVASGLASIFTYFQYAAEMGLDVELIAPHVCFLTTCNHVNFFEEIAKHRAMRKIYAEVMRKRFKAKKPESLRFEVSAYNGGTTIYREQYLNNIARSAIAALAMVLSGCQNSSVKPYDEQYGTPTEEAVITAIRTRQVVAYETGITEAIDPLAGSRFVESLTSEIEEKIREELAVIEKRGGVIKCIEDGYLHCRIAERAYEWQKAFERGEILRVGVNCFTSEADVRPTKVYRADPQVWKRRIAQVQELRRQRDNKKVNRALDEVKAMACSQATAENNIMPAVMNAVRVYATNGEICDALREIWGEYIPTESRL